MSYSVMKYPDKHLTMEQVRKVLKVAKDILDYKYYIFLLILFRNPRRISEVLQLRPSSIDYENKRILWRILKKNYRIKRNKKKEEDGKKKKSVYKFFQYIPADDITLGYLKNFIKKNDIRMGEKIFDFHRSTINRKLIKIEKILSFPIHLHPHIARHSLAVFYASRMTSPEDFQILSRDLMVHSNLNITSTYLQFSDKRIRQTIEDASPDLPT